MNTNYPSLLQNWISNQLVTPGDMNDLTQGVYNGLSAVSKEVIPCILAGYKVSYNGSTSVTITNGMARCQDTSGSFLPTIPEPLFCINEGATLVVPNTQNSYYIILTVAVNPQTTNQIKYNIDGVLSLVATSSNYPDPANNIVLATFIGNSVPADAYITYNDRANDFKNLQSSALISQHNVLILDDSISYVGQNYGLVYNPNAGVKNNNVQILAPATNLLTVTLPDVGNINGGDWSYPISININNITTDGHMINVTGNVPIMGTANYSLNYGDYVTFYCLNIYNNSQWYVK